MPAAKFGDDEAKIMEAFAFCQSESRPRKTEERRRDPEQVVTPVDVFYGVQQLIHSRYMCC